MAQHLVVVVVDDEPDLRDMLVEILQDEGFAVISLPHPSLALTLEQKPSIFLLDLMLPEMTGIELAEQLREGPFSDVTIIALSASPAMLRRAADSNLFQSTLHKPFDIDTLLKSIRQYAA
jgi:DNA-binding response OmpR family regulator